MSSRLGNLTKLNVHKTIEKHKGCDTSSDSHDYVDEDSGRFEELAKLFFSIKSALQSADTDGIFRCWDGARDLARLETKSLFGAAV